MNKKNDSIQSLWLETFLKESVKSTDSLTGSADEMLIAMKNGLKEAKKNPSYKLLGKDVSGKEAVLNIKSIENDKNRKKEAFYVWIEMHKHQTFVLSKYYKDGDKMKKIKTENFYTFVGYEHVFTFHIFDLIIENT